MKPIGYWLNRTDQALTSSMNGMLAEFGLTRIAWQVLNVVHDTPRVADADVLAILAANADTRTLSAAIDTMLSDGWVTRPAPNQLVLTPDGQQRLVRVAERVDEFRELSTTGISGDEYRTAVEVLERMARNLETATDTAPAS
ncbi:MarR family winged helix-turn-helix transcriptional regulator [Streptoalloteichus hindustanus]|uniref:DNA-binding transcriptional regulator, MarR family n=1 Tax=Streptoalloteichus hindustanus TaxID=2017 RepID=A0A1M5P6C5_STRHI|nr:MarR family winged helix-turn-helix transcriptional regulator [Streptoalloteichus hindustanus]SHG97336.1 DNA-binding transcriptional regulator, MarR family [Streptoalloteichus hindustanus]